MHENSPKMRQMRKLERKAGNRPPYSKILIVCEGKKTEPFYLDGIRMALRIPSAYMEIMPSAFGTGPEKVVEFAECHARSGDGWDEVYCVFDRDDHAHYTAAVAKAAGLKEKLRNKGEPVPIVFEAVPSVPCFELWLLLHYEALSRESHRDEVLRRLKDYGPGYEKNLLGMYERTCPRLNDAYRNAATLRVRKEESGNENPSTDMDKLVKRLHALVNANRS